MGSTSAQRTLAAHPSESTIADLEGCFTAHFPGMLAITGPDLSHMPNALGHAIRLTQLWGSGDPTVFHVKRNRGGQENRAGNPQAADLYSTEVSP